MKNYTKVTSKFIEDIQSNVTIYTHNKTGARVCTIENDDNNKVFSIAFRTPPMNNGGLTHILEHSVLCGSKKYPVKDPFVELLKSSLNTFLNAFTFPDKTMYPCASQNDKDFKNLMSVYMDAVFYPQIYSHEEIFMQEGWHHHILDENEPVIYNGVVYNEMKGAFSDPQQILFRNLMHSLYPDTAYGFESGGDPTYIPDLTYEEFKEFHSKYYHPSNSYIFLYGNCDMEERMNWLDEAYLSSYEHIDFDTTIKYQKPFAKPVSQTAYYPVAKEVPLDNKSFLSYNVAFPTTLDPKLMIATTTLVDVLLNNPGAPLKQALIDAQLGADVMAAFDDGLLQPLLGIVVVNADEKREQEFINLVDSTLKDILAKGLDHEALKSLITFAEFKVREGKFSYMPKGLEIEMSCLNSWLYDENQPFSKLENLKYYQELREDIDHGYFEKIITDLILNNPHKSYAKLCPSYTCAEEKEAALTEKLAKFKASLSKDELQALIEKNKALAAYQSAPSTPEEIATLPKLELEDLNPNPEKLNCEKIKGKFDTLFSDYYTNGIDYVNYSFDLTGIDGKTIQYAQLLSDLLKNLSTENTSYFEINQLVQKYTGGLSFNVAPYKTMDRDTKVNFSISFSALGENVEKVSSLVQEILFKTNFKDYKRLYERMNELNAGLEMSVAQRGHVVSLIRASSYFDEASYLNDSISGIGYIDFVHDLFVNFEAKKEELSSTLEDLILKLFNQKKFILRFTGKKEALDKAMPIVDKFYNALETKAYRFSSDYKAHLLNEGIRTQFDVNFVAKAGNYKAPFNGAMLVLNNCLSLDYLWMQVRVHGGAYGCMLNTQPTGGIGFTSYRDPEIARTKKVYEDVVSYIENLNPSDEDLLKYKIGAIGGLDTVMHVSDKGRKAQSDYLAGNTYELQSKIRKQALNATKKDLTNLAPLFKEALAQDSLCVIGNANKVDANKDLFKDVRNLTK
ncbi:MAG: insulinase family protein [Anaeroplasmataceae bacterium]|nr:insulinase family protein [Anaeroplasmataceae bacterium]